MQRRIKRELNKLLAEKAGAYLKGMIGAMLPDAFLLGGIAAMTYGVSLMSRPGAFIAGGAAAIILGLSAGFKK